MGKCAGVIDHTTTRDTCFVNGLVHVVGPPGADAELVRETTDQDQRHYALAQQGDLRIWTSLVEDLSTKRHGNSLHLLQDSSSNVVSTAAPITHAIHAHMHKRMNHISKMAWQFEV